MSKSVIDRWLVSDLQWIDIGLAHWHHICNAIDTPVVGDRQPMGLELTWDWHHISIVLTSHRNGYALAMDWQWICTGMALDWHRIGRIGKGLALDLCGIGTKFVNGLAPKWCMIGIDTGLALDWRPSDTACQPLRLWNDIGLTSDWHQIGLRLSSDWHQICWIGNNLALYMQWVDTQVMRIGSPLAFDLHKSDNWHGIDARLISEWQWISLDRHWIDAQLTLDCHWIIFVFSAHQLPSDTGWQPISSPCAALGLALTAWNWAIQAKPILHKSGNPPTIWIILD